jgi:SAM-dependent methyltransferase
MHIHEKYQRLAMLHARGRILKTDLWNCAETEFPIATLLPNVTCIEVDEARVEKARRRHPGNDFRVGSVTDLPFPDAEFDTVLDFSTIDHVPDPARVLDEYQRVLKPGGVLVLVVWLVKDEETVEEETAWGGKQFFFEMNPFVNLLKARFRIEGAEHFADLTYGPRYLYCFICRGNTSTVQTSQAA